MDISEKENTTVNVVLNIGGRASATDGKIEGKTIAGEEFTPEIKFGATQGRKGHKAPRINLAFSPENHAWIKSYSRQLGISATELVNTIIEQKRIIIERENK